MHLIKSINKKSKKFKRMIKPNRNREKEYFRTSNNNNFSRKNIIIMSLIMSMI